MFGSSWANPQQNQQQQQQPGAFGQPSAFGSTTNTAFGSTSAFGQPQQQNQAQTGQPQVNPMFGNLGAPSTTATSAGFGAFGGTNTGTSGGAFGSKPAGGFGAFGGGPSAFGGGGTGAFGQATNTAAPATTSVFGQPAAPATTGAFGQSSSLFGGTKTFGSTTGATIPGTEHPVVTTGTASPAYQPITDKDQTSTTHFQSITCMPAYAGYSFEELRVQDYAQGRKTAAAPTGAFGQPSAFGATAQPATGTSLFGQPAQQPSTGLFGSATNTTTPAPAFGAFGAQTTTQPAAGTGSIFGGTGAFGQAQPQQTSAFGGGGTGAFGQVQQPQQQTSIFGGGGAFGTAAKPSVFGTATGTGAFGTPNTTTTTTAPAFGTTQPQQPAQGTGLFGSTQPATNQPAFGAFGGTAAKPSIFGTAATTQPTPSPFGAFGTTQPQQQQAQQPAQQTSLFGSGSLFGQQQQPPQQQQQGQTSLFGGQQTTTPSLFGGAATGASLFGTPQQQQQQPQQGQQQPQQQSSLFGNIFNKPAQPATGASLFGLGSTQANAAQPQQSSLFGGGGAFGQSANTNLFGNKPGAPLLGGSLSGTQNMPMGMFGASAANVGAQGTLTASINQPIAENLPIFAMLPPGPRLLDVESTAKKHADIFLNAPTRSPVPRMQVTPANSKLRGFATMSALGTSQLGTGGMSFTAGKPNALSLSRADGFSASVGPDFLGRSGSPALGSGTRQSVKKVILDKKPGDIERFIKSGSPGGLRTGKVTFSPALSVASREKDASVPLTQESLTPASRTPSHKPSQSQRSPTLAAKAVPSATAGAEEPPKSTELEFGDYWMKPALPDLKKSGFDKLSAYEGLVVGRKGYGEIRFLEPVDLTGLTKLTALLGDVVRFDDKECSVYPDSDESDKPPPGTGLNVRAQVALERCWVLDKATREPITDPTHPSAVKHLKRLKNMKDTHFIGFDIKTGTWTFTVDHF